MARIVGQALPIILLMLVGEMFAGGILGSMHGLLRRVPGLLVLVPALLALRGHIHAALGSRLSSAVHLGLIPAHVPFDAEVRTNILASLILSTLMGALAGLFAHLSSRLFTAASAGWLLVLIGASVGLTSAVAMAPIATQAVRVAFRRGIDPDNVVAPILLTFGDLITVALLFLAAALLVGVVA